jgi:hypothetical protein
MKLGRRMHAIPPQLASVVYQVRPARLFFLCELAELCERSGAPLAT